jgi:hypothetical protein
MADPSSSEMTGGWAFNSTPDVRFEDWVSNDHEPTILATAGSIAIKVEPSRASCRHGQPTGRRGNRSWMESLQPFTHQFVEADRSAFETPSPPPPNSRTTRSLRR